jgi:transcriptional regulator with XRE-family HTH domain
MTKEQFKFYMDELKMSSSDIAFLTGNTPRAVQLWLRGTNPVPQAAALMLMAYRDGRIDDDWLIETVASIND